MQAGTLSGNPLAMVAGLKTLEILDRPGVYEYLEKITDRLITGLLAAARDAGHEVCGGHISGACQPDSQSTCSACVTSLVVCSLAVCSQSCHVGCRTHAICSVLCCLISLPAADVQQAACLHTLLAAGMFGFFFTKGPVRCFEDAKNQDGAKFARWHRGMLERGVYLAPSAYEAGFMSIAHTQDDIENTIAAAREVFASL